MAFGDNAAGGDAWTSVVFGADRVTVAEIARPADGKPQVRACDGFAREGGEFEILKRLRNAKRLARQRCTALLMEGQYQLLQVDLPGNAARSSGWSSPATTCCSRASATSRRRRSVSPQSTFPSWRSAIWQEGAKDISRLVKRINQRLIEIAAEGRKVVLCIDESQTMPRMTLESLRLLPNLETEKRKLLHIILFGQPELDEMLATHATRQIRQRIAFAHRLRHLDADGVKSYVEQRLVNILVNKALLSAFGEGRLHVEPSHVKAAARDTEGVRSKPWWSW